MKRHIRANGEINMESETDIKSFLPLSEATFFILMSLSPGPKHGYAILKDVQQLSQGRINFSTGTLYGALKRLLDQGWIKRSVDQMENADETGRSRKDYELTSLGKKVLGSEIGRMKDLVNLAVSLYPKES